MINLVCIVVFVPIALSLYVDNTDLTDNDISLLDVEIAVTEGQKDFKELCTILSHYTKITYFGEMVLYFWT